MASIAEAAAKVLQSAQRPLHSREIAESVIKAGLDLQAKSPDHSVQAAIWRHIHRDGNKLGFAMVGNGRRRRTYWLRGKRLPNQSDS
jgi:HB1, ASXL, restriction endonuclease HTH domain